MQYRKKPVVIEALKLKFSTGSQDEIIQWSNNTILKGLDGGLRIPTLEGMMVANTGDYIIKGVKGEYYPCKPDVFEMTYESVDTSTQQENIYTEEDMMEYSVWVEIESNSALGRNRTSKDLLSEWVKQHKKY